MMQGGQIQQEAPRPTKPLLHSKSITKIGNWNVTLYQSDNIAQAAREMTRRGIDNMGAISETHWIGQRKLKLSEGEAKI